MKKKGVFKVNKTPLVPYGTDKMEVELEEALDIAGTGKYQFYHCALMLAALSSSVLEMISNAFILPAAACDLKLPENLRGIITSLPNIGVILTTPFWGWAADSIGRKPVLLTSSAAAGVIALVAAFMPGLTSFALCKLASSLFLASPSSLSFAYAGEIVPRKHRDTALLICNGLLTMSSVFSPLLAWGILSNTWRYQLAGIVLRPWRLLAAVYAAPLIITALFLTLVHESPKFLMLKDKQHKALEVLKYIYAVNYGTVKESFPVTYLKKSSEDSGCELTEGGPQGMLVSRTGVTGATLLLSPPHLKWLALTGFLMFGLFSSLNGLFLFAPDTVNKVMNGSSDLEGTVCVLMNQKDNETNSDVCVDSVSHGMFHVMVLTSAVYGLLVMMLSLVPVSKKTLLIGTFAATGAACLISGLLTNRMVAGIAMSALQLTSLAVGPLTAYAVQLFPTNLRGTAVGAVLMMGRVGSVAGANIAGVSLAIACTSTFYCFAAILFLCSALSFLLPRDLEASSPSNVHSDTGR